MDGPPFNRNSEVGLELVCQRHERRGNRSTNLDLTRSLRAICFTTLDTLAANRDKVIRIIQIKSHVPFQTLQFQRY